MLLQLGADDAELAGDVGAAGADLVLAGDHVELVVLTGGGAMLPGIADAAAAEMGKRVRIGLPRRAEGESALLQRPDSVVAAGLVQCAIDAGALGVENAWGVRRRQGFRERLKTFFIGDY